MTFLTHLSVDARRDNPFVCFYIVLTIRGEKVKF